MREPANPPKDDSDLEQDPRTGRIKVYCEGDRPGSGTYFWILPPGPFGNEPHYIVAKNSPCVLMVGEALPEGPNQDRSWGWGRVIGPERNKETMTDSSIFISHTKEETRVAIALGDFIEKVIPNHPRIFCSSDDSRGLRAGDGTTDLREWLSASAAVIAVVTPKSRESGWVMAELGGAWVLHKPFFGLVHPKVPLHTLGPLKERHLLQPEQESDLRPKLSRLVQDLAAALKLPVHTDTTRVMMAMDAMEAAMKPAFFSPTP